jgi:hypothetical protein
MALAGEYQVPRILFDCGAMKGSLVGESEGKIRAALNMIERVGGKRVLVIGTCNGLEALSAAMRRRFNSAAMWFFDLPTADEKAAIWAINKKRFGITETINPPDNGWSSANIRDCCRAAYIMGQSLAEAAKSVVSATNQDSEGIERLRNLANGRMLATSTVGPYKKQSSISGAAAGRMIGGE